MCMPSLVILVCQDRTVTLRVWPFLPACILDEDRTKVASWRDNTTAITQVRYHCYCSMVMGNARRSRKMSTIQPTHPLPYVLKVRNWTPTNNYLPSRRVLAVPGCSWSRWIVWWVDGRYLQAGTSQEITLLICLFYTCSLYNRRLIQMIDYSRQPVSTPSTDE